ncbi:MAG: diacylglycerol kinase [Coriobacteriia bacterium]|nr:diacylglycerol kinase [Coriobacteriia bacterium]
MRILVVQNLRAGPGSAGIYDYVHALGRQGVEVVMRFLSEDDGAGTLLADAGRFDRIVAGGGDGTVSAVAYELRETGTPLVIYPAGTANLVAMNLRMPADPLALARTTLEGPVVKVDMGEMACAGLEGGVCRPTGFLMAAGAGFDASIMEGARSLKAGLGAGAYLVAALQNLTPTVSAFTLDLDGRVIETEGIAVLILNFARIQFDLAVTHDSDAQDGLFEVVVLHTKTAVGLIPAIWGALLDRLAGNHPDRSPSFEIHAARRMRVTADPPLPVQYDGEAIRATTPLDAVVLPAAATLVVPPGAADEAGRLSPA